MAPHDGGLSVGPLAQDRAARRQPITLNLGSLSLPQPGDGFVTPGLHKAVVEGKYKTPPSGVWVVYDNPASSDRVHQVLPVSVEAFVGLVMVLDVYWHLYFFQLCQCEAKYTKTCSSLCLSTHALQTASEHSKPIISLS